MTYFRNVREPDILVRGNVGLFYRGWPSQWHPSDFRIDGVTYNCAEQYMMAGKARLFGDTTTLELILKAKDPQTQKSLGRKVRGFKQEVWEADAKNIVYRGNRAKYEANPILWSKLDATEELVLAEAAPRDPVWGIGLAATDPDAAAPATWRGTNWLGEILVKVRTDLRQVLPSAHRKPDSAEPIKAGSLRIWHIVNPPREAFRIQVADVNEAKSILRGIARYDLFVGDGSEGYTTVGARAMKLRELGLMMSPTFRTRLKRYAQWLLAQCPGGVPLVAMNAQGLEVFEDGEWVEWHDDEDRDFSEVLRDEE